MLDSGLLDLPKIDEDDDTLVKSLKIVGIIGISLAGISGLILEVLKEINSSDNK